MTQSVDVLPKRMFKCEECSKEFTRKTTLRDHEARMHRKEERFSCFVCKKGFYDKSGMRRHLSVHDEAAQNRSQFYILNIEKITDLVNRASPRNSKLRPLNIIMMASFKAQVKSCSTVPDQPT